MTSATMTASITTADYLKGRDLTQAYGISVTVAAETAKVVVLHGSDGIYYLRYHPDTAIVLEDFREYEAQLLAYLGPNFAKIRILVDPTNLVSMTRETRRAIASAEVSVRCVGLALIARSSFAQALGGFFIYLDRPEVPTRLFTAVAKAREWLLSLS